MSDILMDYKYVIIGVLVLSIGVLVYSINSLYRHIKLLESKIEQNRDSGEVFSHIEDLQEQITELKNSRTKRVHFNQPPRKAAPRFTPTMETIVEEEEESDDDIEIEKALNALAETEPEDPVDQIEDEVDTANEVLDTETPYKPLL